MIFDFIQNREQKNIRIQSKEQFLNSPRIFFDRILTSSSNVQKWKPNSFQQHDIPKKRKLSSHEKNHDEIILSKKFLLAHLRYLFRDRSPAHRAPIARLNIAPSPHPLPPSHPPLAVTARISFYQTRSRLENSSGFTRVPYTTRHRLRRRSLAVQTSGADSGTVATSRD